VRADVSLGGYFERMELVGRLLTEKAGLSKEEVSAALTSSNPATKEKGAKWLRAELQRLRDAQKGGGHPTRRGTTLSLLEIADVAFTMLEVINCTDDELLALLQELLNVDRHRRWIAANLEAFDRAASWEAQIVLQGAGCGVRKLARYICVSISTASQWKRSPEYKDKVAFYTRAWTDRFGDYVEMIEAQFAGILRGHAFRIAMMADAKLERVRVQLSDERMRRDPDVLKMLSRVFEHIRTNFSEPEPPITIVLPPKEDFSIFTPEDVRRQEAIVMDELTKMVGAPNAKAGRPGGKNSAG